MHENLQRIIRICIGKENDPHQRLLPASFYRISISHERNDAVIPDDTTYKTVMLKYLHSMFNASVR